jgi:hypothetical protein
MPRTAVPPSVFFDKKHNNIKGDTNIVFHLPDTRQRQLTTHIHISHASQHYGALSAPPYSQGRHGRENKSQGEHHQALIEESDSENEVVYIPKPRQWR